MRNLHWLAPLNTDSLGDAAITYATNGWPVFPLVPREKLPLISKAQGGNGFYDATTDLGVVRAHWKREPRANIGLGLPEGVVVLDVDGGAGIESRKALEAEHGPLPFTMRQTTGSDGEHWIMADSDVATLRQDTKFRPGLDTRCAGRGYIVAAPSVHPDTGKLYRWHTAVEPQPLPSWLRVLIAKPIVPPRAPYVPPVEPLPGHMLRRERYARAVLRGVCEAVATTAKGGNGASGRNDALNKGWWRVQQFRDAVSVDEARAELTQAALACGLDEREISKVLR